MSTETKDRITCHVLDTTLGQPARGVRVKLELLSSTSPSSTSTAAANNIHTATHASLPPPPPTNPTIFESQTDDDGRVRAWLPYSSATSSGEVPVYTLEDVLGGLAAANAAAAAAAAGGEEATGVVDGAAVDGVDAAGAASSGGAEGRTAGGGESRWTLRFDTAGYFGGADKTFYPEVVVTFTVREGERYHVPLLLAPYGYSTYRGS